MSGTRASVPLSIQKIKIIRDTSPHFVEMCYLIKLGWIVLCVESDRDFFDDGSLCSTT